MDMCPAHERAEREADHDISIYECIPGTESLLSRRADINRCCKKYKRSAAAKKFDPINVRPSSVLLKTINYLIDNIVDSNIQSFSDMYKFVQDRMRAIRNDYTVQSLHDESAITAFEYIARFHILSIHEQADETPDVFDQTQNLQKLTQTLTSLGHFYNDNTLSDHSFDTPYECEMRAYTIMTQIGLNDRVQTLLSGIKQQSIRESSQVQFAIRVHQSVTERNYIQFFTLLQQATYLQSCLMHRHIRRVRLDALKLILGAYQSYPVDEFNTILCFDSIDDTYDYLNYYNISIDTDNQINKRDTELMIPDTPYPNSMSKLIHNKLQGKLYRDIIKPIHATGMNNNSINNAQRIASTINKQSLTERLAEKRKQLRLELQPIPSPPIVNTMRIPPSPLKQTISNIPSIDFTKPQTPKSNVQQSNISFTLNNNNTNQSTPVVTQPIQPIQQPTPTIDTRLDSSNTTTAPQPSPNNNIFNDSSTPERRPDSIQQPVQSVDNVIPPDIHQPVIPAPEPIKPPAQSRSSQYTDQQLNQRADQLFRSKWLGTTTIYWYNIAHELGEYRRQLNEYTTALQHKADTYRLATYMDLWRSVYYYYNELKQRKRYARHQLNSINNNILMTPTQKIKLLGLSPARQSQQTNSTLLPTFSTPLQSHINELNGAPTIIQPIDISHTVGHTLSHNNSSYQHLFYNLIISTSEHHLLDQYSSTDISHSTRTLLHRLTRGQTSLLNAPALTIHNIPAYLSFYTCHTNNKPLHVYFRLLTQSSIDQLVHSNINQCTGYQGIVYIMESMISDTDIDNDDLTKFTSDKTRLYNTIRLMHNKSNLPMIVFYYSTVVDQQDVQNVIYNALELDSFNKSTVHSIQLYQMPTHNNSWHTSYNIEYALKYIANNTFKYPILHQIPLYQLIDTCIHSLNQHTITEVLPYITQYNLSINALYDNIVNYALPDISWPPVHPKSVLQYTDTITGQSIIPPSHWNTSQYKQQLYTLFDQLNLPILPTDPLHREDITIDELLNQYISQLQLIPIDNQTEPDSTALLQLIHNKLQLNKQLSYEQRFRSIIDTIVQYQMNRLLQLPTSRSILYSIAQFNALQPTIDITNISKDTNSVMSSTISPHHTNGIKQNYPVMANFNRSSIKSNNTTCTTTPHQSQVLQSTSSNNMPHHHSTANMSDLMNSIQLEKKRQASLEQQINQLQQHINKKFRQTQ